MPRSVILFDLDGTLVDSARDIAVALSELSRSRGGEGVPVERVRPLVSLGAETLVARALGPVAGDPREDVAAFRRCLREVASDPEIIFPAVETALDALVRQGWRLAIVTNKPEALSVELLAAHRLDRFFLALVGGDTVAHAKPHPAPVLHALGLLGAMPTDALYVGDSMVDAAVALRLAIPLLVYSGGYGAEEIPAEQALARFANFAELPALIDACRFAA